MFSTLLLCLNIFCLLPITFAIKIIQNVDYENTLNKRKDIFEIIDISEYNTVTDFQKAASNIDGVLIRIGYRGYESKGNFAKDKKFEEHYNGFNGKTKIGYYFVTQAISISEAEEEAEYIANILKGKSNDFPLYLDIEYSTEKNHNGRADNLSKQERTEYAIAFLKKAGLLGYRAGVYTSESWYKTNLIYSEIVNSGASIWVAKYSTNIPSTNYYEAWQYTNKGEVSGIKGSVDRTQVYQDLAGWNGAAKCGYINTEFSPNIYSACTNHNGICITTDTCEKYSGKSITGKCPNDPNNIKCCDNIPCQYNGINGNCIFKNQCSGTLISGLCPGNADFICCISNDISDNDLNSNQQDQDVKPTTTVTTTSTNVPDDSDGVDKILPLSLFNISIITVLVMIWRMNILF